MPFRRNTIPPFGGPWNGAGILLLLTLVLAACSRDEPPRQIDFSQRQDVKLQVPACENKFYFNRTGTGR